MSLLVGLLFGIAVPSTSLPEGTWRGERIDFSEEGLVRNESIVTISQNQVMEETSFADGLRADQYWQLRFLAEGKVELLSIDGIPWGQGSCGTSGCHVTYSEGEFRGELSLFFQKDSLGIVDCGQRRERRYCHTSLLRKDGL